MKLSCLGGMMKILCLLLPHFPLKCELLRKPDIKGRSVIITRTSASQKLVLDFSPGLDGLQADMPLQQALARHGEAELLSEDFPYYRSAFNGLLDTVESISPLVEGTEMGCVYIGADGLQLIYPDDESLIDAVFHVVTDVFTPQVGVGSNKFLAYLAARRCSPDGRYILTGDVISFLRELSCDVLPVSMKSREKLRLFGLHTLGQVAALPPGPLLSQFGTEGKRIHDLARGHDDTPLYPRMMEKAIEESITLSSVTVSLETLLVTLEGIVNKVFNRIGRIGLGIRSMNIWTQTWNAEHWERAIRFKQPALDTRTVINRIRQVMEEYPQPGPVEQLGLVISRLGFPGGRQNSLFREVRSQAHLMEDIRQLELRLGKAQVYRVKEVEPWSRIPERRYVLAPTNR